MERNAYLRECGVKVTFEHREHRKRGEAPDVEISYENIPGVVSELEPGEGASRAVQVLEKVPEGQRLVVKAGTEEK